MKKLILALPLMAMAATAQAQNNPLNNLPDPMPPALTYLTNNGVKLTYLGDNGGLQGYLGESPTGQVQTFYLTPDGNHVVAGILFRRSGVNVTGLQIEGMKRRFEDARKTMEEADAKVGDLTIEDEITLPDMPQVPDVIASAIESEQELVDVLEVNEDDFLSNIDPQAFKNDVESVAWFSLGVEGAPVIYMVADPQCPFCHQAWSELRPRVMNREINVRVILIDALTGSRDKAISLLARDEPGRAWFNGEGSISGFQIAPPPATDSEDYQEANRYLMINRDFAAKYGFNATPYLIYEDRDGQLRTSRGNPRRFDHFLSFLPEQD